MTLNKLSSIKLRFDLLRNSNIAHNTSVHYENQRLTAAAAVSTTTTQLKHALPIFTDKNYGKTFVSN